MVSNCGSLRNGVSNATGKELFAKVCKSDFMTDSGKTPWEVGILDTDSKSYADLKEFSVLL